MKLNPIIIFVVVSNAALFTYIYKSLFQRDFVSVYHDAGSAWQLEGNVGTACHLFSDGTILKPFDATLSITGPSDSMVLTLFSTTKLPESVEIGEVPLKDEGESRAMDGFWYSLDLSARTPSLAVVRLGIIAGKTIRVLEESGGKIVAEFGGGEGKGREAIDNWLICQKFLTTPTSS